MREREREWCLTGRAPLKQGNNIDPITWKHHAKSRKTENGLTSPENTFLWKTMVILQEAPAKSLENTTKQTRRKVNASDDALIKRAPSECSSKLYWWRMSSGSWRELVLTYAPLMKSTKKFPQDDRYEGWGNGTTNTSRAWRACNNPPTVQCGHGL